jgi:peptidoglycan/xylan/chitin deacetylase (PgdA/CDA1 family)
VGIALLLAAALAAAPQPVHVRPDLRPVPILMYHVLAPPPSSAPYPGLYVAPAEFRAEVDWLAAHGFTGVTLDHVWQARHGEARLPRKPVVLSFDDGYRSDTTVALPVLRAHRWPGVLNLEVANLKPVWGARPGEVRRLIAAGWEIDAHTLTHPDLTTLGATELWRQVEGSRAAIRLEFHVPVSFFCYPSGRYDQAVEDAVRRAGFLGATTTSEGLWSAHGDPFALERIRVNGGEGAAGLAASLRALGD